MLVSHLAGGSIFGEVLYLAFWSDYPWMSLAFDLLFMADFLSYTVIGTGTNTHVQNYIYWWVIQPEKRIYIPY